jgi:hypothetical protein
MISGTRSPHEHKAGRTPYLGGSFLVLPFNSPSRTKHSAAATMDSWFDRGAQPGMRLGFSLVAFFILPSSGKICFTAGGSTAPIVCTPHGRVSFALLHSCTLRTKSVSQLEWNQPVPHSFPKQPGVALSRQKFPVRVRYGSQATIPLSRRGSRQSRLLCVPPRTRCLRAVLYSGGRVLSRCGQVWSG